MPATTLWLSQLLASQAEGGSRLPPMLSDRRLPSCRLAGLTVGLTRRGRGFTFTNRLESEERGRRGGEVPPRRAGRQGKNGFHLRLTLIKSVSQSSFYFLRVYGSVSSVAVTHCFDRIDDNLETTELLISKQVPVALAAH